MSDTAANRKLWVEALRSGEFKQARGRLRDDGCYCCLGVACEVYRLATGEGRWERDRFIRIEDDEESKSLPDGVRDWLGLRTATGMMADEKLPACHLTNLNDVQQWSLEQIGVLVEREPEGLLDD